MVKEMQDIMKECHNQTPLVPKVSNLQLTTLSLSVSSYNLLI